MTHTHDHEHDHNHEPDYITLVDENGNESLFQILITIDGQEEFGKNYVVLQPPPACIRPSIGCSNRIVFCSCYAVKQRYSIG